MFVPALLSGLLGSNFYNLLFPCSLSQSFSFFYVCVQCARVLSSWCIQVAVWCLAPVGFMGDSFIPKIVKSKWISRNLFLWLLFSMCGYECALCAKPFPPQPCCRSRPSLLFIVRSVLLCMFRFVRFFVFMSFFLFA